MTLVRAHFDDEEEPELAAPASSKEIANWLGELKPQFRHCILPSGDSIVSTRQDAESKRKQEFFLGRACAESQLALFGEHQSVGVNEDRSPVWPDGFVGSISHSNRWTWAIVGKQQHARSVGVDTEIVVAEEVRTDIEGQVADEREIELIQNTGLAKDASFTLIFSAKEAIYKCCYPIIQTFFGFEEARLVRVATNHLTFQLADDRKFAELPTNQLIVYYRSMDQDIFTITWLDVDQVK